jgi:hypothetical protein
VHFLVLHHFPFRSFPCFSPPFWYKIFSFLSHWHTHVRPYPLSTYIPVCPSNIPDTSSQQLLIISLKTMSDSNHCFASLSVPDIEEDIEMNSNKNAPTLLFFPHPVPAATTQRNTERQRRRKPPPLTLATSTKQCSIRHSSNNDRFRVEQDKAASVPRTTIASSKSLSFLSDL